MTWVFAAAFAFVLYTYVIFPVLCLVLGKIRRVPIRRRDIRPDVAVIIPAYNEAEHIVAKVRNVLSSEYPADRLRVIVVSDGSTDNTVGEVRAVSDTRVSIVELPERRGKVAAINAGVASTTARILVLTDAQELFERHAITCLVENFADPNVGAVTGDLHFVDEHTGVSRNLGWYWRYEKGIRAAESASGSVVGVTGAICAVRRACFAPLPEDTILDDVAIPFEVVRRGHRVIFDSRARAFEVATAEIDREFLRKRRTLAGNYQLIVRYRDLLLPWRSPIAWRFWSHKVFRLLVPYALVLALIGSAFLDPPLRAIALGAQGLFYGLALLAYVLRGRMQSPVMTLPYTFCMLNWAALAGSYYYFSGLQSSKWEKTK